MSVVPTFVFYFFGVINTWSRLPIFGLNELERSMSSSSTFSSTSLINITVERPLRSPNFDEFVNSPESFHQQSYLSVLSVCSDINQLLSLYGPIDLEYQWNFSFEKNAYQISNIKSKNCSILWQAPYPGNYRLYIEARHTGSSNILFHGSTKAKIHDYWIVAIGDSFASGEGNPDQSLLEGDTVKWISDKCHRSHKSWPYFVYSKLQKYSRQIPTHVTYIPCAGAAVDLGILNGHQGQLSQLDVVEQIAKLRGRGPDLLMMAIGGNDVGYSDILSRLFLGNSKSLFNTVDMRLFYLAHELERLGERLNALKANQVVIPHYFDISRNEKGFFDSNCSDLHQISTSNLKLADRQILRRVNRVISEKAKMFQWTVIDSVPKLFRHGGICSTSSLIRSTTNSIQLQGDTLGAFHPIETGHQLIADLVWKKLDFKKLLRFQI